MLIAVYVRGTPCLNKLGEGVRVLNKKIIEVKLPTVSDSIFLHHPMNNLRVNVRALQQNGDTPSQEYNALELVFFIEEVQANQVRNVN